MFVRDQSQNEGPGHADNVRNGLAGALPGSLGAGRIVLGLPACALPLHA